MRVAISYPVLRRAVPVSFLVGSLLNIINQWESLLAGATIDWFHLLMNYLIPYSVASYSCATSIIATRETLNGS